MIINKLSIRGDKFVDESGRSVMLRGINLGGDSKLPLTKGETWLDSDFSDHREVCFIGRPFPLDEADEHLSRLRSWGFNCLRLITTWEAVEHAGIGQYDSEYLDYFSRVCELAGEYGFYVIVDFHQDTWSRMTGGSGAPGWTLELVGLEIENLERAGAALTMQRSFDAENTNAHQDSYPSMCWQSNYNKPANGIMWTLFWAGSWVTPNFNIDGINVQYALQQAYLGAVNEVAKRVANLPNVIGFDSLNEPSLGWLGRDLSDQRTQYGLPGKGLSPLFSLAMANGNSVDVPIFGAGQSKPISYETLNPSGVRIWADGVSCPFEVAGIYRVDEGHVQAIKENVFATGPLGHEFSSADDVFEGFFSKVASTIRSHNPDWLLFAEIEPMSWNGNATFPQKMPCRSVNASHWYDIAVLYLKQFDPSNHYNPFTGIFTSTAKDLVDIYEKGLAQQKAYSETFGPAPSLIGEFGMPFDLNLGSSFEQWNSSQDDEAFQKQEWGLSLIYDALDRLLLNGTLWNYSATNRNDLRIGDGWNQEDLSIYSKDQAVAGKGGGRAVLGFARPYVRAAQGEVVSFLFDQLTGAISLCLKVDATINCPTEVVLPIAHFPFGIAYDGSLSRAIVSKINGGISIMFDKSGEYKFVLSKKHS